MNIKEEEYLTNYLWENPDTFFSNEKTAEEVRRLGILIENRGGIKNPYGVPIEMLWGVANIKEVVDYLSGIHYSKGQPLAMLRRWVVQWIEKRLIKTLKPNGNALEWYILETLIQGSTDQKKTYLRPTLELDANYATDLLCIQHDWFHAGGKTLGIQITVSGRKYQNEVVGLGQKRNQIKRIVGMLIHSEQKQNIQQFWDKMPQIMSLLGVYGKLGNLSRNNWWTVFYRDIGLWKDTQSFAPEIRNESRDIADFVRMSIDTWNIFYLSRRQYSHVQSVNMKWRAGEYTLEWRYRSSKKRTEFQLLKENELIGYFEISDPD